MRKMFFYTAGSLLYLEGIYHIGSFGFTGMSIVLLIPVILLFAAAETICLGFGKKCSKVLFWTFQGLHFLLFASQLVYYHIFKKALLWSAVVNGGQAALTNFWKETLNGIGRCSGYLLLMALPMIVAGVLLFKKKWTLDKYTAKAYIENSVYIVGALVVTVIVLVAGYNNKDSYYEEYQGMYAPENIVKRHGVLAMAGRDLLGDLLPEQEIDLAVIAEISEEDSADASEEMSLTAALIVEAGIQGMTNDELPTYDISPNVLEIDMEALASNSSEIAELAAFMDSIQPTKRNEYTGMFEGYNLIYLTAEGFAPYAVVPELMPTLYQMMNSGIVVEDYYVPLWQTSTSDGEYVNLTGQIPDSQFSMKRTKTNAQPYSLPAYFATEGVKSFAYHNNSLSYYDRYLTHPNLGYDFKAAKSGSLSETEYASQLFSIESASEWPESDYEMIVATLPEYINEERFHAYYMTVSGHMEYNFAGNAMSGLNKDVVAELDCSETMKAYIACNYELEKAMAYLVAELEKAGKLDNTVIVISADHYPYGLETGEIEAYTGEELEGSLDLYKNCLIMWNSAMETIEIDKTCCSMDIIPTLLNLFGFEYDSRLFAGRDMLAERDSLVVFSDRSFITDSVIYNQSTGTATSRTGEEIDEVYLENRKAYVKALAQYSAGILNEDYFKYVAEATVD